MTNIKKYSFKRGFDKIPLGVVPIVKLELIKALGDITLNYYYYLRAHGIPNISIAKKEAIEGVFAKFGVKNPKDIWDVKEEEDDTGSD